MNNIIQISLFIFVITGISIPIIRKFILKLKSGFYITIPITFLIATIGEIYLSNKEVTEYCKDIAIPNECIVSMQGVGQMILAYVFGILGVLSLLLILILYLLRKVKKSN